MTVTAYGTTTATPPMPAVDVLVGAGLALGEILELLAQWTLIALPAADGICLVVETPTGLVAGSAGLADDLDPAHPFTQDGVAVGGSFALTAGATEIGALNVYLCQPGVLEEAAGWNAAVTAAALSGPVVAALVSASASASCRPAAVSADRVPPASPRRVRDRVPAPH